MKGDPNNVIRTGTGDEGGVPPPNGASNGAGATKGPGAGIQGGSFRWAQDGPNVLSNINVDFEHGQLTAVVGRVGSGKSSLISALLGDMEKQAGRVVMPMSVAYVPQQAWIRNCTVRDNILFGKPYDAKRYRQVITACALEPDLQILPGGDMTEIGEKGINLR